MKKVQVWMVYGSYGSGKTLFLTYLATIFNNLCPKIYANYKLIGIQNAKCFNEFTVSLLRSFEKNSLVLYSESYKNLDKRESMSKAHIGITHEIQEIRKQGYDLVIDAERPLLIESRITRIVNKYIKSYGNFIDILKKSRTIYGKDNEKIIIYVKRMISNKNFAKKYSLEDLQHLFLYEIMSYDTENNMEIRLNKFIVLDGRKIYPFYSSEDKIHKSISDYINVDNVPENDKKYLE